MQWQSVTEPCPNRPTCRGKIRFEISVGMGVPWVVRPTRVQCDACAEAFDLEVIDHGERCSVRKKRSGVRYHVTGLVGGGLKNDEFEVYCEILQELGHATEREQIRVRQPDGSVRLLGGRLGLLANRAQALEVKSLLEERLSHLQWQIDEVP